MLGYYIECSIRSLKRSKGLSALMVLALSVGIGASVTTLTVMRLLSGNPLPGASDDIYYPQLDASPDHKDREPLDALDYKSAVDLWSAKRADQQTIMANSKIKAQVADGSVRPVMLPMLATTADFFSMFHVPIAYGRGWSSAEDDGRARVAVISHDLNNRIFKGRNSVGESLRLNDTEFRVVGVLAPWRPSPLFYSVRGGRFSGGDTAGFYDRPDDIFVPFESGIDANSEAFLPFTCWAQPPASGGLKAAPCAWVALWVKIEDKQRVAEYERFLSSYAAQQKELGRIGNADNTRLRDLMGWLEFNNVVPRDVKIQVAIAFAFLAICITNVIGLQLAKFLRDGREMGLRRALGASRGDLVKQCLMESCVIGSLGGAGGLLLSMVGLHIVRQQPVTYAEFIRMDATMFLSIVVISIVASLVAGALPALRASRVQPAIQLKVI